MREKIKLINKDSKTGKIFSFYTTFKNKKNTTEKVKIKKYCKVQRKRVLFVESKIK